jgi:hypothetical protein
MGPFGRASAAAPPAVFDEALPKGLRKRLLSRSSSGTATLGHLRRGELKNRLPRLHLALCQPCPRWGPSRHGGCRAREEGAWRFCGRGKKVVGGDGRRQKQVRGVGTVAVVDGGRDGVVLVAGGEIGGGRRVESTSSSSLESCAAGHARELRRLERSIRSAQGLAGARPVAATPVGIGEEGGGGAVNRSAAPCRRC